jgi:hypothetical protein
VKSTGGEPGSGTPRAQLRARFIRYAVLALILTGAFAPWYLLRQFPIFSMCVGRFNLLDVLFTGTLCLTFASLLHVMIRRPQLLPLSALVVFMLIPLMIGLAAGNGFSAVREFRPFMFYLLTPVLIAAGFQANDYRVLANVYVIGTTLAVLAVFAHIMWLFPLPGYRVALAGAANFGGARVFYLDWTVPVVALLLGSAGLLTEQRNGRTVLYACAILAILWYMLAMGERFVQFIGVIVLALMVALPQPRRRVFHRLRIPIVFGCFLVLVSIGSLAHVAWLRGPLVNTISRWREVQVDDSFAFRVREVLAGLRNFALSGGARGVQSGPSRISGSWKSVIARIFLAAGTLCRPLSTGPKALATNVTGLPHAAQAASTMVQPISAPPTHGMTALLFGEGLGEAILVSPSPHAAPNVWHYFSSGYALLLFHGGMVALVLYLTAAGWGLSLALKAIRARGDAAWPVATIGAAGTITILLLNILYPAVDVPEGAIAFSLFYAMTLSNLNFSSRE